MLQRAPCFTGSKVALYKEPLQDQAALEAVSNNVDRWMRAQLGMERPRMGNVVVGLKNISLSAAPLRHSLYV